MKYTVTYEETLAKTIIVEADSKDEAMDKVYEAVERGDIVLTDADYIEDSGEINDVWETEKCEEDFYEQL